MMTVKHKANGKEYDIESRRTECGFEVQTHLSGKPVGPLYSVTYDTAANFKSITGEYWKEELTRIAIGDLDNGTVK